MTVIEALKAQAEIESVLQKHQVFYSVTHEHKPGLRMIRFNEISIKIIGGASTTEQKR